MNQNVVYLRLLMVLCHMTLYSCSDEAIKIKFKCFPRGIFYTCVANGLNIQSSDKNVTFEMGKNEKIPRSVIIESSKMFSLPPELFRDFTQIKELVASNISLENIYSETFAEAKQLRYLILSNNRIQKLIDNIFINASELLSLKLQHNQINSLSSHTFYNLTELRTLILSFNLIASLPLYIFRDLTSLDSLFLDNNQIKVVSFNQFSTNLELAHLHLEKNELVTIDSGTFENLTKLEQNYLSGNICVDEDFSPWFPDHLNELDCCSRPLGSLPDCLNEKIKKSDQSGFNHHFPLILTLFLSIVVNFTVLAYCLIKGRRTDDVENIELITANDLNGSAYQVY